jgi:hypothetical protein
MDRGVGWHLCLLQAGTSLPSLDGRSYTALALPACAAFYFRECRWIMNSRQLTADEIVKLGQEIESYRRYRSMCDYVLALYDPQAHQATYP